MLSILPDFGGTVRRHLASCAAACEEARSFQICKERAALQPPAPAVECVSPSTQKCLAPRK